MILAKTKCGDSRLRSRLEPEDALPVVLHADNDPAILLGLVEQLLSKRTYLRVGEALGWPIRIFAHRIVVEDEHFEPRAIARCGVFEHLTVAGGVAKRRMGPPADHQVNALGLTRVVVILEKLRVFGQDRLTVLVIAIRRADSGADNLLGRNTVDALGVDAHEVLAAAGDDVGLEAIGT